MSKALLIFPFLFFLFIQLHSEGNRPKQLDSLKQVFTLDDDIKVRSFTGLVYSDLMSDYSYDSAMWAVDYVIRDCEASNYEDGLAQAKTQKAWLLLIKLDYEQALTQAHEALEILEKPGRSANVMAETLNILGLINMELDRLEESKIYFNRTLALLVKAKDKNRIARMGTIHQNLGVIARPMKQYDTAIYHFKEALKIRLEQKDYKQVGYSNNTLGSTFLEMGELDSAGYYFERSLENFNTPNPPIEMPDILHFKYAEYLIAIGKYDEAIDQTKTGLKKAAYLGVSDRVIQGNDLLAKALYKSGQYQDGYDALMVRNHAHDSLFKSRNASAIAEIEERYQSAETEKKLAQSLAENLEQENRIIEMRFYVLATVIISLLFIFLSLSVFWFRNQKKKVTEAGLKEALATTKLVALRSQMNSHFIFNCVNTAQNFVLNGETEKAYEYLSQFARLLRGVLENSNLTFVPLEDEIDLIKNYLEIESTRFNGKFSYDITMDEKLQNEVFEIPSMIIQPFVENAIVHGLVNLEGRPGHLGIELNLKDQQIICRIEDNGVGREKAREIKQRKQKHYKSQAFSNIKERLNLFNQNGEDSLRFTIFDLYDKEGSGAGTRAKIWLPIH
ncbi:histidine kinase [bacterium SCSIO 12741]|nr:histidine kinase [bacterium SCSIO 12741]